MAGERSPWHGGIALAILVAARTSVSFQFQSVAPLSGLLEGRFPLSLSGLGLLFGAYMGPGVVVALGLPSLISRFGRSWTTTLAFLLMASGEVLLWAAPDFTTAVASRLLAGVGGCIAYIVTINMVADFKTRVPSAVRMGLIAAAWPLGNALALGVLGPIAALAPETARYVPLMLVLIALGATWALHLPPTSTRDGTAIQPSIALWVLVIRRIWTVALSFALYNIGFIILTGFAAKILTEDGHGASTATGIASIPMWMFLLSVPLGGLVAGHSVRGDRRLVAFGCFASLVCVLASSTGVQSVPLYVLTGLAGGLPTAPILARARMAYGESTDLSYSALFFIFFAGLIVLPPLAGVAADMSGTTHTILWLVAGLLGASVALFFYAVRHATAELDS